MAERLLLAGLITFSLSVFSGMPGSQSLQTELNQVIQPAQQVAQLLKDNFFWRNPFRRRNYRM